MIDNQTVVAQNIDYNADQNSIKAYFSKAGTVQNIKILTDSQGKSRGIAFITYSDPEEAKNSIKLFHNSNFNGRKLFVEFKKIETNSLSKNNENSNNEKNDHQDLFELIQTVKNRLDSIETTISILDRLNNNDTESSTNKSSLSNINNINNDDDDDIGIANIFSLDQSPSDLLNQNKQIKTIAGSFSDDDDDYSDFQSGLDEIDFTNLSNNEAYQAKIFKETMKIIKKGSYHDSNGTYNDIKRKVADSNKNTMTIERHFSYDKYIKPLFRNKHKWGRKEKSAIYSKIEITDESTLSAASRIKGFGIKEVVILNFASATKAGGGVNNNKIGQEEALVRQSSLYLSLIREKKMYKYNRSHKNPFYSNYMIYSPNVVVIRDDDYNLIYPFRVSVISAPAVNNSEILKNHPNGEKNKDVYKCMKDRSRKILQLAISMKNRAIVLGAYGCGIFGNNPKYISKIFKELLIDEYYGMFFTKIIFAIKGKPHQKNYNMEAFQATFNLNS